MPKSVDSKTGHEPQVAISATELVRVSTFDFALIVDLVEHPPKPNTKLFRAIAALPSTL